jgi:cyclic pyranopterin phosphate synthase
MTQTASESDQLSPLRLSESDDALVGAIHEAISRKPKGHDFVIDRRRGAKSNVRHMSVTGG